MKRKHDPVDITGREARYFAASVSGALVHCIQLVGFPWRERAEAKEDPANWTPPCSNYPSRCWAITRKWTCSTGQVGHCLLPYTGLYLMAKSMFAEISHEHPSQALEPKPEQVSFVTGVGASMAPTRCQPARHCKNTTRDVYYE